MRGIPIARVRLRPLLTAAGVACVLVGTLGLTGTGAKAAVRTTSGPCVVHSNPSMVEMGLGATSSSIADVIQVECQPIYSEDYVEIDGTQLSDACHNTLSWSAPYPYAPATGPQFKVQLDNDGNATAVVWGGPSCAASTSIIFASLLAPPFATFSTTFTVKPPRNTAPGVSAHPASIVEDEVYSSAATIIQVEFPAVNAEQVVNIKSDELFARCNDSLTWVGADETVLGTGDSVNVTLDDNGNAFVAVLAGPSCAAGKSTITADLLIAPYTTYYNYFRILSPRPTI